jgi:hypothetical protein
MIFLSGLNAACSHPPPLLPCWFPHAVRTPQTFIERIDSFAMMAAL